MKCFRNNLKFLQNLTIIRSTFSQIKKKKFKNFLPFFFEFKQKFSKLSEISPGDLSISRISYSLHPFSVSLKLILNFSKFTQNFSKKFGETLKLGLHLNANRMWTW